MVMPWLGFPSYFLEAHVQSSGRMSAAAVWQYHSEEAEKQEMIRDYQMTLL